jgi:hypothetical protein
MEYQILRDLENAFQRSTTSPRPGIQPPPEEPGRRKITLFEFRNQPPRSELLKLSLVISTGLRWVVAGSRAARPGWGGTGMSVKSRIIIPAAVLSLLGGIGAAGALTANAATTACGASCTDFYNADLTDNFMLAAAQGGGAGQPISMFPAGGVQAEDFSVAFQGRVSDFVAAGLMDPQMGTLYGSLLAYEIQWAPGGQPSGFCVGVQGTPSGHAPVTLQPCGVSAATVWISDPVTTENGSFDALINGATEHDFKHPASLTASPNGDVFTDSLKTEQLASGKANDQLWGTIVGAL